MKWLTLQTKFKKDYRHLIVSTRFRIRIFFLFHYCTEISRADVLRDSQRTEERMKHYYERGITERISSQFKQFSGEVRTVTVCFISIGFDLDDVKKLDDNAINELHEIFVTVQKAVSFYEVYKSFIFFFSNMKNKRFQ